MFVLDLACRTKAHPQTALEVPARHGTAHANDPAGFSDGRPSPPSMYLRDMTPFAWTRLRGIARGLARGSHVENRVVERLEGAERPVSRFPRRPILAVLLPVSVLLTLALVQAAPASAAECPNEQLRDESNVDPATGQHYSQGLPECRAYEMVTPVDKQQHDALRFSEPSRVAVSSDGGAIAWSSEGDYANPENYRVSIKPTNPYVAQRAASGWDTRSAYPPTSLIEEPAASLGSGFVPLLSNDFVTESDCGTVHVTSETAGGPTMRCALREPDGSWAGTPKYTDLTGETYGGEVILGASSTGEDVIFSGSSGIPFLSADTSKSPGAGIYEMAGVGTASVELRLVNVDNNGSMIGPENPSALGALGGSAYQAISADGSRIYFTATPSGSVSTVYARVAGDETVPISDPSPSDCTTCSPIQQAAVYQGASEDGAKVFFTTSQQLLDSDTDETADLYEYNFDNPPGRRIVQVSRGGLGDVSPGTGANVRGVVGVSEDGSHVYFAADGALTTLPNGIGQAPGATLSGGAENVYGYDTETGETKFVATLPASDAQLWGAEAIRGSSVSNVRLAQTTPNGGYLVFDSFAKVISSGPEADTSGAQQVYRYDFQTGKIIRVSLGHEGYANNGNTPGFNAVIAPADNGTEAATPTVNYSSRSISESGGTIAFVSAAQLQSTDVAGGPNRSCEADDVAAGGSGCEVYVWHECPEGSCVDSESGEVNMISDGRDPNGVTYGGMSATGSDIVFQTRTQLVGQDTDSLGDIYDARVDGGIPAPKPEPSCSGEACQGTPSTAPTFSSPGTVSFTGGADDVAPPFRPIEESAAPGAVKITAHSSKSLSVSAPGAGKLRLTGSGLATLKKTAPKAGPYTLAVTLTSSERKLLAKRKSVTLKVRVTFTPASGKASSATTKVTIKKASAKKAKSKRKGWRA